MSEIGKEKKPWSLSRIIVAVLLGVVVVCVGVYFYRDKPAKLVQTTDITQEVDYKRGEIVDYHFAFNAAQEEELGPPEENGWRLILQALGPRALEQNIWANTIPWDEFPTNPETKSWFEDFWTPLCEKFNLDPRERPTLLDAPTLWDYLAEHGLSEDYNPFENDSGFSRAEAEREALTELSRPWTAEDYPNAARWFEENAAFFDVLAKAARSPQLRCWHKLPEAEEGGAASMLLPDVRATQYFADALRARACFRVGSGDISGAIDDVETATLIGRAAFGSEFRPLVEPLAGLKILESSLQVPLFENATVAPTAEDLARLFDVRASLWREGRMKRYAESALVGDRRSFASLVFQDFLWAIRNRSDFWDDPTAQWLGVGQGGPVNRAYEWSLFKASALDDARAFRYFDEFCEFVAKNDLEGFQKLVAKNAAPHAVLTTSAEKRIAFFVAKRILPLMFGARNVFEQCDCLLKESAIVTALHAYRLEHGTFPPAFSVDADGAPLHSWRVLILPYLGADAKALYDRLRLDEPWDSEHNAAFHSKAPEVYRCGAADDLKEGETSYSVLLGDDGFFDESGVGKDWLEMTKRPELDVWRIFLLTERPDPICWMKPDAELKIADYVAEGNVDAVKFFEKCNHNGGRLCAFLGGDAKLIYGSMSLGRFWGDVPEELLDGLAVVEEPKEDASDDVPDDATP